MGEERTRSVPVNYLVLNVPFLFYCVPQSVPQSLPLMQKVFHGHCSIGSVPLGVPLNALTIMSTTKCSTGNKHDTSKLAKYRL